MTMPSAVAVPAAAVIAVAAAAAEYVRTGSPAETVEAFVAAGLALAVAALAATLPGITPRGVLVGGFLVLAGMLTWTATDRPVVIWAVLALGGVASAGLA